MVEPEFLQLNQEDVGRIDATYGPIREYVDWASGVSLPRLDLWEASLSDLVRERETAGQAELSRANDFVMRAAALDSGAIEGLYSVDRGFTITVAAQAAAWESDLDAKGENARALFDAQLRAIELVLDAATQQLPVTEAWVRSLHDEVTAPQPTYKVWTAVGPQEQPLPRGVYKEHPNHVRQQDGTIHAYAPVDMTLVEMHRLVSELTTDSFTGAHPALQSAYVHHALTAIHPFADGNGRVARALASVYLYRAASVPLLIFADRRDEYFDVLASADDGAVTPLVGFIFDAAISAMKLVTETARTGSAQPAAETLASLSVALVAKGSLTHHQLDEVARKFLQSVESTLSKSAHELHLPPGVHVQVSTQQGSPDEQDGFRHILTGGGSKVRAAMSSQAPANAGQVQELGLLVSRSRDEAEAVVLVWPGGEESLGFSLRDIHPEPTAATQHRVEALAERVLGRLAEDTSAQAQQHLRKAGY